MRRASWAIAIYAALALAVPGRAEADDQKQARAAFQSGVKHFEAGRYQEALASFQEADRLAPTWKLLYNIAQCQAALKRYGEAVETFERYLAEGGDDVEAGRRDEVLSELQRLRQMVGSLDVRAPDGAEVAVDGQERGQTPLPGLLLVAAGVEHKVVVTMGDAVLLERTIKVSGGQSLVLEAARPAAEQPPAAGGTVPPKPPEKTEPEPAPVEEESPMSASDVAGWVLVGVGAAAVAGGAVVGGLAISLDRDLQSKCIDGKECPPAFHDDIDERDAMGWASTALIGAGAAMAVAGVLVLVLVDDGEEVPENAALVMPSFGVGDTGLGLTMRF